MDGEYAAVMAPRHAPTVHVCGISVCERYRENG